MRTGLPIRLQIPSGRLAAIAILAGLVLTVGLTGVELYRAYAANHARITDQRLLLGRLNAVAAQADAVGRWASEIAHSGLDGAFLSGSGDAQSSADLQARIAQIAAEDGAVITRFRAIEQQTEGSVVDVEAEVSLQGSLATLLAVIARIEASRPWLLVENAELLARRSNGRNEGAREMVLDARLNIRGFALARRTPPDI